MCTSGSVRECERGVLCEKKRERRQSKIRGRERAGQRWRYEMKLCGREVKGVGGSRGGSKKSDPPLPLFIYFLRAGMLHQSFNIWVGLPPRSLGTSK